MKKKEQMHNAETQRNAEDRREHLSLLSSLRTFADLCASAFYCISFVNFVPFVVKET